MTATLLLPLVVTGVVAYAVAEAFRRWALGRGLLDQPNHRSSHVVPTPRGGGVGIVLGFVAGLAIWLMMGGSLSARADGWLAGGLLVAGVSLLDDVRGLPALPRLAIHLLAAVLLTVAGAQGAQLPWLLAYPLAFVWVALVTNIYNFMDGIDGLAASQAIVTGAAFAAAGAWVGNPFVLAAGALLAAAAAGFLPLNWPPARIFMGDVSSTFLGFSFAGLALLGNLGVGGTRLPIAFGVVALAPFLFDTTLTLVRRLLRGERWYQAHRSHLYQRLVAAGLSHGQVTGAYTALAVWAAVAAVAGLQLDTPGRLALSVAGFVPMLAVVAAVWWLERARPQLHSLRS